MSFRDIGTLCPAKISRLRLLNEKLSQIWSTGSDRLCLNRPDARLSGEYPYRDRDGARHAGP